MKNIWIKKFITKIDERIKNSIAEDIDNISSSFILTDEELECFQKLYKQRYKEHLEYKLGLLAIKKADEDVNKILDITQCKFTEEFKRMNRPIQNDEFPAILRKGDYEL